MTTLHQYAKFSLSRTVRRTAEIFSFDVPADDAAYTYAYAMAPPGWDREEFGPWWRTVTYVGYTTNARQRALAHFDKYLHWAVQVNRVLYSPPVSAVKARKMEVQWSCAFACTGQDPFYLRSAVYQEYYHKDEDMWPTDAESVRFWGSRSIRARHTLLADPEKLNEALDEYHLSETYRDWWLHRYEEAASKVTS